ncbi:MAG: DUF547 domain-containing protein [Saprospiraceae bacterium]
MDILFQSNSFLIAQANYLKYNSLLNEVVDPNGKVNYQKLKTREKSLFEISKELRTIKNIDSWSKPDQLAYWINLYNLQILIALTEHYKVKSILDIENGKIWDLKKIEVMGTAYSLNEIENEIIRKKFKEARIHFAINCGAESCPPLMNRSYTGKNLEEQLNQRTRAFINNPKNIVSMNHTIKVSKIFDWFKDDFGNLLDFINLYSDHKYIGGTKVEYLDYSWNLNEKK